MRAKALPAALIALAATTVGAQTIGPVDPGASVTAGPTQRMTVNGVTGVSVNPVDGANRGYLVPDARGGYVMYAPAPPLAAPRPSRADSEEVRLFARELAAQITTGRTGDTPLFGVVSVPSAFVNQDTRESSSFGRLMGEQMIYELVSRGFPVKEFRGGAAPKAKSKGKGKGQPAENLAVLAGTYYHDKENLFVNARLVEPSGRVLRTGSVVLPITSTLRAMLGMPEPGGFSPTPPTIIGARDVNDPPGMSAGSRTPVPYAPKAAGRASPARKKPAKAASGKVNCPPGCEPIDTAAKTPAAAPQPGQPQSGK